MQQLPTVGDTVTVVRHVNAPPGAMIEARAPVDSNIATLVGPPVLTREGDSVRIAYSLAVWRAGHNDLVLPGAIIVDQRGHVDTLADGHVPLDVATVLPAARSVSVIPPKAAGGWFHRAERSELPFAVFLPLALLVMLALWWWWRRRGPRPGPDRTPAAPALTDERINAWVEAGEARLALEHLSALVRDRGDFADWRARADVVRFAAGDDAAVAALVREGWSRLAAVSEPIRGESNR